MSETHPNHPIIAATLDLTMRSLARVRERVVPEAEGRVLELGCGTGLNFRYYREQVDLVAIEPDPHMRKRAHQKAAERSGPLELLDASAEELPFEDRSFDTVVATFVLCTIPRADRALAESLRVLRPGGRLLFAEHVRSVHGFMARCQDVVTPAWKLVAGGCHLNRPAVELIEAAGFEVSDVERRGGALAPIPVVWGKARPSSVV